MFDAPKPITQMGCWTAVLGEYTEILGYTLLGNMFIRHVSGRICMLMPFDGDVVSLWCTTLPDLESMLRDPGLEKEALHPDHVGAIAARLGEPAGEEVYIPRPYPSLGGSGAPETYDRGDLWVFWELVGQMHGMGGEEG